MQSPAAIKPSSILAKYLHVLLAWPLAAMLLGAVLWTGLFGWLDDNREAAREQALKEVAIFSRAYADHVARTLESIDQVILHVKYEWELAHGELELETIRQKGLFPPDSVFQVGIINPDGIMVTSTFTNRSDPGTVATFWDRPYFKAQKAATKDELYIGEPVIGRNTGKPVIQFSRRLTDGNGRFEGVVLAAVSPAYFTANYDSMTLGGNGFLALANEARTLLTLRKGDLQSPPAPSFLRGMPPAMTSGGSTVMLEDMFADNRARFVGWQPVGGYPLVAMTGLDEADALVAYRVTRHNALRVAYGISAGLAALTLIAMTLHLRLVMRRHQLAALQNTYRMATEGGKEGFYIVRPSYDARGGTVDFVIVDSNQRGAEMFGRTPGNFIGMRLSEFFRGEDFTRQMALLTSAMEAGNYEVEVERRATSPLGPRWVHIKILRSDGDLAVTVQDISDTKAHIEELERRSNHDALTGLPNRRWMHGYMPAVIEQAARSRSMFALLYIDLDGFKGVNDSLGHAAGDELLIYAAKRLKDAVRPQDHVIRLAGDEFVIVVEHVENRDAVAQVAERILSAFRQVFHLTQGVRAIGASVGISLYPDNGMEADRLLQNADFAMYIAKMGGKGCFRFYDPEYYEAYQARMRKERELRLAIDEDQFEMHYQPRVDTVTGKTCSMEALVRWRHPEKGILPPHEFIPLAEETGMILALGELVIDKVCMQLSAWAENGKEPVPVSINVSARQFHETDIQMVFARTLERTGVNPGLVEIEVTESVMMGEDPALSEALTNIQGMGIKLCIDDFGTGYSSLSQLQQLDFDVLKVDRAFTLDVDKSERGNIFVKAIITMAHALGMRVVAEGVESESQMKTLQALRCDELQGFYICRPLVAADIQSRLAEATAPERGDTGADRRGAIVRINEKG